MAPSKPIELLFLLLPFWALSYPLKVPTEYYEGHIQYPDHRGNAPLISDLTFRSICDHVIAQETEWFDPDTVGLGDTVYLNLWYLEWFQKEVHDRIKNPYILVTCDVGSWFPDPMLQRLLYDPKLSAWFCRNMIFSHHPKLFQIPMGQTDRMFGYDWLIDLEKLSKWGSFKKKHLLYMNHFPRELGDRIKIIELFKNEPYCFSRNENSDSFFPVSKMQFYHDLESSQFVISPWGLESDCVRTWEALVLHCIPIVEHSFLDPLFQDMPVLFVHDWTEINKEFLEEKYTLLKEKRWDKAYFYTWENQIRKYQEKVRNHDFFSSQLEATKWSDEELRSFIEILEEDGSPFLIYKGFLTPIHTLQLARSAPFLSKIYLSDPWIYPYTHHGYTLDITFPCLKKYVTETSLFEKLDLIVLLSDPDFNGDFIPYNPFGAFDVPIFLDLSYFRHSLIKDFGNFRHSLLADLEVLYDKMNGGALLVGSKGEDPYVSEVLERLIKKKGVVLSRKGSFWFFRK